MFPAGSAIKNLPTGDTGSIPLLGSSPGEGNGNPFQYSCLKNAMDRGGLQFHGELQSMKSQRIRHD